ncbi:N-acyl homoserine lactonase family protein [Sphingomonas sp.]|uniref:N-acyl homoserine lactonase family protein n=1 Tax=Sphingomonas sp. TaxID=28214 RepID=UPI0025EE3CCA|nr:N-acyl homoserine lactonase family protein [Sphingomonas sp.]
MTILGSLLLAVAAGGAPVPAADVELWRLDCGEIAVSDFAEFSDSHRYDGKPYRLVDSCYLIRHGDDYLLWDTGLPGELEGKSNVDGVFTVSVKQRILPQLARIGVKPGQIDFVGISHNHFDHIGQAADFPGATLLIGAQDLEALRTQAPDRRDRVKPWLDGGSKAQPVTGDHDVFGDGSVVMLGMPGHTDGHHSLLVRLRQTGPVLLSGDQFHASESFEKNEVPSFNSNRADTLASSDRFRAIAANLKARVVIQHEPADVAKLPAFPASAR